MKKELPIHFEHKEVEQDIYREWEESGAFTGVIDGAKEPFCVVIPPPNVTGVLHLGHVLDNLPQDIYTRWHRMRGFATVWIPGTDHAGIATQAVVKRKLTAAGIDTKTMSREEFLKHVWEWVEEHRNHILIQLRRLGCSCDWTRTRFTMDEQLTKAVRTAFVRLYNKKLIYRGVRMINWCTSCGTAIADDEIDYQKNNGSLWHIRYPFVDGTTSAEIIVATTRPETMLGDTAVAVNPNDERYTDLVGKQLYLPLTCRTIPLISDDFVETEFGTGAVKITPAHDFNDYAAAERQKLEIISVIDEDGKICAPAPERFVGLTIVEARKKVVAELEAEGLLVKVEKYQNNVSCCDRCKTALEPRVSKQWFCRLPEMAKKARNSVETKQTKIIPQTEENDFYHWMDTVHDWCISRQLWWGHRIPVFTCAECGHQFSEIEDPKTCPKCSTSKLSQEEDVLDTWFSSGLWPFSVLGWPDETLDLKFWFPNNVLFSGRDIMFFWDTKMMSMALELLGEVPFRELVLHGLVMDEHGKKMSKSLGNTLDPLQLFDEYGVDAVRAGLADVYPLGRQDTRLGDNNFKKGQALVTKLWNSSRLLLSNISKNEDTEETLKDCLTVVPETPDVISKWIISRLKETIQAHDDALAEYNFQRAFAVLNTFFWSDFCDWYLEIIKPKLRGGNDASTLKVAIYCIGVLLRLFHPYIPFVTENLWQFFSDALGKEKSLLTTTPWVKSDKLQTAAEVEKSVSEVMAVIREIREARQLFNILPKTNIDLTLSLFNAEKREIYDELAKVFEICAVTNPVELSFVENFNVTAEEQKHDGFLPFSFAEGFCYFKIPAGTDIALVKDGLNKKLVETKKLLERAQKSLANDEYISKAPKHIVEETKANVVLFEESIKKMNVHLNAL